MKYIAAWVLGGIALLTLFIGLWFGGVIFSNKTANFRGNASVINKTRANGNYRIAAYDHFFDLCAAVQSTEGQIKAQKEELNTQGISKSRFEQVVANISALKASRYSLIAQYNADADESYTKGQFRDSKLPYHIDFTERDTTCVV